MKKFKISFNDYRKIVEEMRIDKKCKFIIDRTIPTN